MKAEPTSQRIVRAAQTLLENEGVEAVSMRRVAASVGVSAMAVYRHYADHDALLNAVADEGFRELTRNLDTVRPGGDIDSRLQKVLDVNLDFALKRPHLFALMFLQTRKGARQFPRDFVAGESPTGSRFAELITEGVRRGVFRKIDIWEVVFEAGALLQGLVMLYLGGRVEGTEKEFRKICHRAMGRYFDGIRK